MSAQLLTRLLVYQKLTCAVRCQGDRIGSDHLGYEFRNIASGDKRTRLKERAHVGVPLRLRRQERSLSSERAHVGAPLRLRRQERSLSSERAHVGAPLLEQMS
ncbi:MAG: hypothetical protein AB4426_12270 [Xenococcaceae cyanobacterium]